MPRRVKSIDGDTIHDLLFKYTGRDDDVIEDEFHKLNPEVSKYGPVLSSGIVVIIPDIPQVSVKRVMRSWD